jgi:hypothetical protein
MTEIGQRQRDFYRNVALSKQNATIHRANLPPIRRTAKLSARLCLYPNQVSTMLCMGGKVQTKSV